MPRPSLRPLLDRLRSRRVGHPARQAGPRPGCGPSAQPGSGQAGFSFLELLVVLVLLAEILIIILFVFSFNTELSRVQTQLTDMQQNLRIGQMELVNQIRTAGRGGLLQNSPAKDEPNDSAVVEVRDNVTGGERDIVPAAGDTPKAVEGTDVLTLRGVFSTPLYQINSNAEGRSYYVIRDAGNLPTDEPLQAQSGEVHICSTSLSGFQQPIEVLRQIIADGVEEALILVGVNDEDYAVVKLLPGASAATSAVCDPANPDAGVRLAFAVSGDGGKADRYRELSSAPGTTGMPNSMTNISFAGILEEYRYFVSEERQNPGDASSPLAPNLARARLFPNTAEAWGADAAQQSANMEVVLAEGIFDLQVALGLDTTVGNSVEQGTIVPGSPSILETEDGSNDDWLFNNSSDDPAAAVWDRPLAPGEPVLKPWRNARLYYVRISTVGRVERQDPKYQAPLLEQLENRLYDTTSDDDLDSDYQRRYRRRVLSTVVDMRNLS